MRKKGTNLVAVICQNCGNVFIAKHSEIDRGRGKFCSMTCDGKSRASILKSRDKYGENNPNW
ncbi:MAG: hypothetical protein AAGU11_17185, partial [Syntrophobacteraceae bacterium]